VGEDSAKVGLVIFEDGGWKMVPTHCTVFEILNDSIYLLFCGGMQENVNSKIFWDKLEGAGGGVGDFFV